MKAKVNKTYQHYKGDIYTLLHIAEHTETNELFVIYSNEEGKVWARPKDMWESKVVWQGKEVRRFTLLDN